MTENEAQCQVTFSEELLQVVRHAKVTNFELLLKDNEPWFYYKYPEDSAWIQSKAALPIRKAQKIQTNNA
jgi:hypothetical protein